MSEFKPPSWAGTPEPGVHLDVYKDNAMIGKYAVDKKSYYLFGRNPDMVDFAVDHVSCSRVHAALVHHKALKRPFLIDLGSTHGTFVGNIRLEPNKPQQLFSDTSFHFGASTRQYLVKEKVKPDDKTTEDGKKKVEVVLPTNEKELESLTIYNTDQNVKLINQKVPEAAPKRTSSKRKRVVFNEEEDVINPEESDPSVGRFQNLVSTEVIANTKKMKLDSRNASASHRIAQPFAASRGPDLYGDLPSSGSVSSLPNSAPDVDVESGSSSPVKDEEHHKKYAKEVWPGKHPHSSPSPARI
ncbi:protein phosphatase 1 regulatory subunit 8 [Ramazzottius varieornatus]|uniref:Protein phosphatase 1 regulatory subunit 8 n=1 Tax=Ramazzottius varieornatus TaxID=947166 RepID=A0A1D1VSI4_RAMVA|nr:protein phosphatase 1 regulatory subunit 8 [Ramazzottius varieornatus]